MVKSIKEALFPGLLILVSPFIYTEKALDPVLVPRVLFFAVATFPCVIYSIINLARGKLKTDLLNANLVWFYFGFLIFSATSIILSINTGEGIWEFLRMVLFFIVFLTSALLLQNEENLHKTLPVIIAIFSITILFFGIRQLIGIITAGPLDHQTSYLINSVLAHRNLYSDTLFFTLPFLMMGIYFQKGLPRFVYIALIAATLFMITIIMVRSVWLAVAFSAALAAAALILFRKSFGISISVFRRLTLWTLGGLLVVMISLAIYSRFGNITVYQHQTHVLQNYQYGSALERLQLWEKSWEMFKESPAIGVGKGNWRILLPHYGSTGMRSAQGEIIYQRPHNDFLWVLSESGFVSFTFYVLIFLTAFYYLVRIIRNAPRMDDRYFALFMLFFLSGYLIIASFSFPMERPVHSLLLSLVLSITLIKYQKVKKPKSKQPQKWTVYLAGLISVGLLAAIVYIGYARFTGEVHTRQVMLDRINSRWHKVIEEAGNAESFFMKLDPTATPLRWYSGLAWYNLGEMNNALGDFEKANKAHPYHIHVLNNLATILGNQDDYTMAKKYYRESVRISSEFTDAALNLSVIYFNEGQIDSAYMTLRNVTKANDHPNYQNVVTAIVYDKLEKLRKNVDDRDLFVALKRIRNSEEWMVKVHEQAVEDNIPLEKHLFIESIYLMETIDGSIDSTRAEYLRNKYLR
jgi:O-antigen ligase